jgi:hypothetical protein
MPRPVTDVEADWLRFLLPEDRPGYRDLRSRLEGLVVLGEGRWGEGDLVLGRPGQEIDLEAGMEPVAAFGQILGDGEEVVTLTLHQPDDEGRIEFQIGGVESGAALSGVRERSRWSYSYWSPGAPCPATGGRVREIELIPGELALAISPAARSLWLFDRIALTNRLLPVTNFYNELVMSLGIRDPRLALDHTRLFTENGSFTDGDLRNAFIRYNSTFRKVDPDRFIGAPAGGQKTRSIGERLRGLFGGGPR